MKGTPGAGLFRLWAESTLVVALREVAQALGLAVPGIVTYICVAVGLNFVAWLLTLPRRQEFS
jgi:hypothetical protein